MKIAGALMALASVLTVVVFILAVSSTKDDLPGDIRACVKRGGAAVVKGPANLGIARREIDAGTLKRDRQVRKGEDTVIVLSGQRFRLLVLANASSPTLAGDLPRRLYERADEYPLVALETDPVKGVLQGCSSIAAG
ncbi:MAG: hypothetical protein JWN65_2970 [Solirubrobacterales bacterium]|jgi:hypothetical protein|nr:hypothetical protein [Solirubrobacterales bacterium]